MWSSDYFDRFETTNLLKIKNHPRQANFVSQILSQNFTFHFMNERKFCRVVSWQTLYNVHVFAKYKFTNIVSRFEEQVGIISLSFIINQIKNIIFILFNFYWFSFIVRIPIFSTNNFLLLNNDIQNEFAENFM